MRSLKEMIFNPQSADEKAFAGVPEIKVFRIEQERGDVRLAQGRALQADEAELARGNPPLEAALRKAEVVAVAAQDAYRRASETVVGHEVALNSWKGTLRARSDQNRKQLEASAPPVLDRYARALDVQRSHVTELPADAPHAGAVILRGMMRSPVKYTPPEGALPYGTSAALLALRGEVEGLVYRPDVDLEAELARVAACAQELTGHPLTVKGEN